ncbi:MULTISPECIES: hypothetical protein [Providencia]|uniref:hypothetical protein n=1 Tax=Providencia TaxID=586 RepID=UPI001181CB9E|nr:hypothetical protein [Providencia rettgeri]
MTLLFMIAAVFSFAKTMKVVLEEASPDKKKRMTAVRQVMLTWLFYVPGFFLLLAPFIKSLMDASSEQMDQSGSNLPVWLYLAGGLYLLFGAALLLRKAVKEKTLGQIGSILNIQILLWVGLYSTFTAYDHLKFADEHFGIMSTGLIEIGGVKDVTCEQPLMLVNFTEGQTTPMQWRCPTGLSFMNQTNRPFVPWPDYTEGESEQLAAAMNKIMTEAKANSQ